MNLWAHQTRGIKAIRACDAKRVLAVAPTGSGKGTMAAVMLAEHAQDGASGVFVVHRREIVLDVLARIRGMGVDAAPIIAGKRENPRARVQVASLQTLLARDLVPKATLAVFDEAHHYAADDWGAFYARYRRQKTVGFTASPQRSDGRAMGDAFDELIEIATYAELIRNRHIVPAGVLRPKKSLGIDLAQDPVAAYLKHANGRPAMVFGRRVQQAEELAERFRAAGIAAECIEANTPKSKRDDAIARMKDGSLTVLTNVFALTEGVDIPRVDTIVLARKCEHVSTYVQIVGRELRAYRDKKSALLIDLTGASHRHGLPTAERKYSLEGSGMEETEGGGGSGGAHEERDSEVLGLDLVAVGQTPLTAQATDPKRARWERILDGQSSVAEAIERYRGEFGEMPPWVRMLPKNVREREMARLRSLAGGSTKLAAIRYQHLFGELP